MFIFNQKHILLFPSNEISDLLRRVFLCIGEKTAVFFFCFEILIILTAMMSRMTFAKIFFLLYFQWRISHLVDRSPFFLSCLVLKVSSVRNSSFLSLVDVEKHSSEGKLNIFIKKQRDIEHFFYFFLEEFEVFSSL